MVAKTSGIAKANDATGEPHSIEFNGETYLVPPADDWDLAVLEAIDGEKMTHALKALLGDEQYEVFRAGNRKVKALGEFMTIVGEAAKAGNSSVSSR